MYLGETIIGLACIEPDSTSLISTLIESGADLNILNSEGRSPKEMCCDKQEYFYSKDKCDLML